MIKLHPKSIENAGSIVSLWCETEEGRSYPIYFDQDQFHPFMQSLPQNEEGAILMPMWLWYDAAEKVISLEEPEE